MRGRGRGRGVGQGTSIDVLPDDVLLVIFDFCVVGVRNQDTKRTIEAWQSLVHVCRRWRILVFRSPRRLNLRLVCTPGTPRESLDVWPALRLLVQGTIYSLGFMIPSTIVNNIVDALGHSHRVCRINLLADFKSEPQWDKILAAMQVPFPELIDLRLSSFAETLYVIPDAFLGGSAPRLQYLKLEHISFPGIPKLLLSATHLVELCLRYIPHSGYISPEAMATCLSALTNLVTLSLGFSQPRSDRESRLPPPMPRSILPNLTGFWFNGVSEYLDDLVARIDAPRLRKLSLTFLHQLDFNTPHLVRFISRTPRFEEPDEADVRFEIDAVEVAASEIQFLSSESDDYKKLALCVEISCEVSDQQVSSMAQVCTMCLPPLRKVEKLRVLTKNRYSELDWKDVENDQWLELLRPFTAVKCLYLSKAFQPSIASTLREFVVGGRTTEVLPSLQNIFLARFKPSGPFQEAIGQFVAARQLSGRPIAVFPW